MIKDTGNERRPPHTVFDGYCERGYCEDTDGWIMDQLEEKDVPSLRMARDIIELYGEINSLRREVWTLRRDAAQEKEFRRSIR